MGFFLALILAAALALFAAVNADNKITVDLGFNLRAVDVPLWALVAGTAVATAFVGFLNNLRGGWMLKRELRKRGTELKESQKRLKQAQDNLQEYEARMHDFALKVVQMSHRQLPAGQVADEVDDLADEPVLGPLITPPPVEEAPTSPADASPAETPAEPADEPLAERADAASPPSESGDPASEADEDDDYI